MGILETVLLVAGVILAVLSFIIPMAGEEVPQETRKLAEGEIKTLVGQEMDSISKHVDDVVDEAVGYAVEKTERSLERLTNEKIMAVNEYSDTVLQEIHKNHEEAVFLYDMLNNKHTGLKNMLAEINKTVQEAEETRQETKELMDSLQDIKAEMAAAGETEEAEPAQVLSIQAPPVQFAVQEPQQVQFAVQAPPVQFAVQEPQQVIQPVAPMNLNFMSEGSNKPNNNEMILEMHDNGKSNVAIAKELGLGVGEVKLVIDLYKNLN